MISSSCFFTFYFNNNNNLIIIIMVVHFFFQCETTTFGSTVISNSGENGFKPTFYLFEGKILMHSTVMKTGRNMNVKLFQCL